MKPEEKIQSAYVLEIIKGLKITFSHLFRPKVTIEYPEKKQAVPSYYRGFPVLNKNERGEPKCVACKLCEVSCPSSAIYIEIDEYPNQELRERMPKIFNINYGRCINCRYCEEACPVDAIKLTPFFEYTDYIKENLIFNKEQLLKIGRL